VQSEGITGFNLVTDADTIIGILPFYHIYGMVVIMNMSLVRGATIVTMPRFDLEQFLQLLEKHQITRANLVPPILLALAKHPLVANYDLSSIIEILSGAAPLSAELGDAVAERLNCNVIQGYGMTETSPVTHVCPNFPGMVKRASVGPALPNTAVKVIDIKNGQALGPNEEGEIWIHGPQVMKGYLNNPDATAATVDNEGWIHTGDIGYVDDDGYTFIVDRLKELIKYKGFQVAPAELEGLLLTNPIIADAAVIPSPDEEAGEIPKAFIVLKPGVESSADEIMAWVAERVSPQKKIRAVQFVDTVPKSASGKILRRVLVEQERAGK
jgi:acyl-CoA synthetase (AMP-forming)/AMP-acid ligase II